MNAKLIHTLTDLGLSDNEAKVYYANLSLGPDTILKISKAAEVKRTTVYSIIDSLSKKGLISKEIRGFKELYVAESPDKLELILERRKDSLASSMPEFLALYNLKGGESLIKYYEGLEAGKSVYEKLLKDIRPHDYYLVLSDQEKWLNLDPQYFRKFIERRSKLNINIRLLFQDSPIAREHQKIQAAYNEQIKILPIGSTFRTNLIITPQRVVIQQLTPPIITMVIENKSMIEMNKEIFELIWQSTAS